jgi:hypothetical protein
MPTVSNAVVLTGSYDYRLVALSVLIAMLASYAALDLAGRVTAARGRARLVWLTGGAAAMGLGIWSMHYIGMLAYTLPVAVFYDWPTVLLSLVAAMLASAIALFIASRSVMLPLRTAVGGVLMGIGIAAMHYTGMEAMRLPAMCNYYSAWMPHRRCPAPTATRSSRASTGGMNSFTNTSRRRVTMSSTQPSKNLWQPTATTRRLSIKWSLDMVGAGSYVGRY